jgi:DNA-binding NtrC family response regulator
MINKAILCVDDEQIVLISLRDQIFRSFGDRYRCELAENAEEAWEVIDELYEEGVRVLVIVSDWLMPGVRGDEFLIQVHQKFPEVVTVLLTGQADAAAIERTQNQANLHACLMKPWTEGELVRTIQEGLEERENDI